MTIITVKGLMAKKQRIKVMTKPAFVPKVVKRVFQVKSADGFTQGGYVQGLYQVCKGGNK
jgi:hypothetical protein